MRTSVRIVLAALCMALIAPNATAANLAPVQVLTDGINDGGPLAPDFELEAQDLIAGYLGETDDTIDFTWQVVDLPDGSNGVPEAVHYLWEFTLDNPTDELKPEAFSLRARAETPVVSEAGRPVDSRLWQASLRSNCTTT